MILKSSGHPKGMYEMYERVLTTTQDTAQFMNSQQKIFFYDIWSSV